MNLNFIKPHKKVFLVVFMLKRHNYNHKALIFIVNYRKI